MRVKKIPYQEIIGRRRTLLYIIQGFFPAFCTNFGTVRGRKWLSLISAVY
jgi:hypothetical protein